MATDMMHRIKMQAVHSGKLLIYEKPYEPKTEGPCSDTEVHECSVSGLPIKDLMLSDP